MSAAAELELTTAVMLDAEPESPHAWIAVDPQGRVFGIAGSFKSCLEMARDEPDADLEQIVRVPVELVRAGMLWNTVEVVVRPGAQLELSFP